MERIHQGRSSTLTHTFQVDGVATNPSPDIATVTIARADGTALVPAGSVTEAGVGVVTLTLTPAETALLDTLTITWTASFAGQAQQFIDIVEIVGGFLFTLAQAKARLPSQSNETLQATRTLAEQELERACQVAFVPRYAREKRDGDGTNLLMLKWPKVRAIRSVSVDETPQVAGDFDLGEYVVHSSTYLPRGYGNVMVGYEHGYNAGEVNASRAALMLVERYLAEQPAGERVVSASVDSVSFRLAVAGTNGQPFDVPYVNQFVAMHNLTVGVA